jgi:hypothetical protein
MHAHPSTSLTMSWYLAVLIVVPYSARLATWKYMLLLQCEACTFTRATGETETLTTDASRASRRYCARVAVGALSTVYHTG